MTSKMVDLMDKVQRTGTPQDWTWLAKFTMARLILFNKRRAEVKDLKVQEYLERPNWHRDGSREMGLALSPVEQMLAKRYYIISSVFSLLFK